jgi:predicted deacylase
MSQPPIELQAPDIQRWQQGNTGVEYVHTFDSGRRGRHVMVQALTHGNELCGAIALDALLGSGLPLVPPRGKLTLSFANVAAYGRWDPATPDASRFVDEDMNRVWADDVLSGPRDSTELRRARALRPFVDSADFLLDIHSMREPCIPLMVCGDGQRGGNKAAALSQQLKVPAVLLVDTGHPAGMRMIDRGEFGSATNARTAVLIECGQHWERLAADVAMDTLLRFLEFTGAAQPGLLEATKPLRMTPPPQQRLVRVTQAVVARTESFQFVKPFKGLEVIAKAGTVIATDGGEPVTTPYDDTVLVMPSHVNVKVGGTAVRLGRTQLLGSTEGAELG